jgi:oxygen-independent coproporphyrinogen III oxidase
MLAAIRTELELRSENESVGPVATVYFGGGTPSLLSPAEIHALLETVRTFYGIEANAEITLECNPDDCSADNLSGWKNAGVNRLSIGIQSFTDEQLEWMNRTHSANEGIAAVQRAKDAGFDNLTVDLIYGLPGLSAEGWRGHLRQVIALGVDHISAYCLTVEEKTPLAKWVSAGKILPADADQQSEQFGILVSGLADAGFEQYEISNFAREGHISRHNSAYWKGERYVAAGPSAHGFDGHHRYWNVANNRAYIKAIASGNLPQTVEELSPRDRFNELLLTGLRTKWGVEKEQLFGLLQPGEKWHRQLQTWISQSHLTETETHFLLTQSGRLFADAIASDLFVV